ncbi:MAG: hypothetical protein JNL69_00620 [Bacteroidia bacterium]|nr:hypothetical protein [Bacteroidia bacterium]
MKNSYSSSNLQLYKNGHAIINDVVLRAFQHQAKQWIPAKILTAYTKIFTEGGFKLKDIAIVLFQTRKTLHVRFSYDLLLDQNKDATIGSLATCIWKNMLEAEQNN